MAVSFGKFQLLHKLATGGMGELFLAREEGRAAPVVLKRILPHLAKQQAFLALFLEEARLAARLQHPNIVPLYELGCVEGAWFLSMEYVPGRDLRSITERVRGPLPPALAVRIAADAAAGLHGAHTAREPSGKLLQVVHGDVSPHNLLVGFDGVVRLLDFGVARALQRLAAEPAEAQALRGKFPYLSPEQAEGGEGGLRSDQFSLGIVLWELLTGRRLFEADSDAATLFRVAQCAVPAPSVRVPAIPAALDALVLRALAKEPAARFPDCGALHLALEDFLVSLRGPGSREALSQWLEARFPEASSQTGLSEQAPSTATEGVGAPAQTPPLAWHLLQPWEQEALAQLSVFRGGFTLEAVEQVLSLADFPQAPWVLDVLAALREAGFLETAPDGAEGLRFALPEVVHAEAHARLLAMGEAAQHAVSRRHTVWALSWAEQLHASPQAAATLLALEAERENLLAVFERARAQPAADTGAAQQLADAALALAALGVAVPQLAAMLDEALRRAALDAPRRARVLRAREALAGA